MVAGLSLAEASFEVLYSMCYMSLVPCSDRVLVHPGTRPVMTEKMLTGM